MAFDRCSKTIPNSAIVCASMLSMSIWLLDRKMKSTKSNVMKHSLFLMPSITEYCKYRTKPNRNLKKCDRQHSDQRHAFRVSHQPPSSFFSEHWRKDHHHPLFSPSREDASRLYSCFVEFEIKQANLSSLDRSSDHTHYFRSCLEPASVDVERQIAIMLIKYRWFDQIARVSNA